MMTEAEWAAAERREPGRTYLAPDERRARRYERAGLALIAATPFAVALLLCAS